MTSEHGPAGTRRLDLRGLKCPLPAFRTRAALARLGAGERLAVECTDPLAGIDIPHLLRETGDLLEAATRDGEVLTFVIRKAAAGAGPERPPPGRDG